MPSPLDVPAIQGISADGKETPIERKSSDSEPFSALAFKIMNDPFVGECCCIFTVFFFQITKLVI